MALLVSPKKKKKSAYNDKYFEREDYPKYSNRKGLTAQLK